MIKQSITDWSCFMGAGANLDPLEFFCACWEIGYRGAEMVPPERQAMAREAGLELLNSIGPGVGEGLNRIENHEKLIPEITHCLEEAEKNRIGSVIVFSGDRNGQPDSEGIKNCAAAFKQLIPDCKRTGVGLIFEMFNTFDHKTYQADHGAYGFELVDAVGDDCLKLLYDVYHMERMGDDYMGDIAKHIEKIGHFHCATAPNRTCTAESTTANYQKIVELALAKGYRGYFGQEFIIQGDVLDELKRAYAALI